MILAMVLLFSLNELTMSAPCGSPGTMLFYLNGMFNSSNDANDGLDKLSALVSGDLNTVTTRLLHNRNEGLLSLLEVTAQRALLDYRSFWIWLAGREKQPSWFSLAMATISSQYKYNDSDLEQFEEEVYLASLRGYKVAVVSHSQGNFYANELFRTLDSATQTASWGDHAFRDFIKESPLVLPRGKRFFNLQLASPVKKLEGSFPWLTFYEDKVISALRKLGLNILEPNQKYEGSSADSLHHSFMDSYLTSPPSRQLILRYLSDALSKMPEPVAGTEAYRVGVDKESNAFFVFKKTEGERISTSGLTRYDSERDKLADCFELLPGTYEVIAKSVGPKRGNARSGTATFTLERFDDSVEMNPTLIEQQISYSGKYEKWKLWTIDVTQNQNGGLVVQEAWTPEFLGKEH